MTQMKVKLDLTRTIYREDETPYPRKVDKQGNMESELKLLDVMRGVYGSTLQDDTKEQKSRKGRLLKETNRTARRRELLSLSVKDADFTLEVGGKMLETPVFVQLEDLIEGRPTLGDEFDDGELLLGEGEEREADETPAS